MYYRILHLKPMILLTNVIPINLINNNSIQMLPLLGDIFWLIQALINFSYVLVNSENIIMH